MRIPPPTNLRCEYLHNPLGVDVERPRLSWVLEHPERSQAPAFFRIIVSSSGELAARCAGDLWDSGKTPSPGPPSTDYRGITLRSFQPVWWRVQWWDKLGNESEWSRLASFETGILGGADWKARWISRKDFREFRSKGSVLLGEPLGDYVNAFTLYLRREFKLAKSIVRATAFVCGLGYYELRVNGRKVGDHVLDPAQTDYNKASLYATYDLIDLLAGSGVTRESGSFAVGIMLGNGRHIKNYGYGHPKALMQVSIVWEDGSREDLCTDSAWKTSYGPLQENGLYYGERYDARLEMRGWDEVGYDDSSWETAVEVDAPYPSSQLLPPIRVVERLEPKRHYVVSEGIHVYDFGQNFAGWVRLSVQGTQGTEITLHHAELLNEDGRLNMSPNQNAEATDVYVLSGTGVETYEPRFTYHGFRYVSVSGFPAMPLILQIEGCVVHSDVEPVGEFACSNNLVNRIHENIVRGQSANLMSIPTDCTQRDERQGWLGDAHLVAEESMFNFDMAAFYAKFLKDIECAQRQDGSLPDVVPPYYLGRLYPADPAWGSAYITIAWFMYQFYGDTGVLARHFDSMKRYIEFLRANCDNHIIKKLGKYGDWCPPGSIAPKRTPVELTATWYYYHDTLMLSRMAAVLRRENDLRELEELSLQIKDAFNDHFLKDGEYEVNRFAPVDRSPGQTSNTLPLYLDMVPREDRSRVLERLLHSVVSDQDYHLDTGILGTRYVLDVLTDNGYGDVAYKVATQRTYPGWGYMVEEGATTLWERWEMITGGGMNSHNHIMFGSVDAWFYRVIAGLSCLGAGWNRIRFMPRVFEGLDHAHASVRTVLGNAAISWQRTESSFLLDVKVPVGSIGELHVPLMWEMQQIAEDSKVLWQAGRPTLTRDDNIRFLETREKHIVFEVGSGEFHVRVEWVSSPQ
ncbi:MAG: family 78 glycoside hydrolase catalytic domain [Ignavibacteriales bacterium]|nr:family 78 glycoside hydrolase catalytic domain [Ignavibacteriales bacterium]